MKVCLTVPALLLAAVLAGCGGEARTPDARLPNVLLITLDTLRADHLGCYGADFVETPTLDGLAAKGVLFLDAVAAAPLTLPSHASLFTGHYPMAHGVRDNGGFVLSENAATLAELFRDAGWRTAGFVSAFVLNSRFGIGQGFDHYSDRFETEGRGAVSPDSIQRRGDETVREAVAWLEETGTFPLSKTEKGNVPVSSGPPPFFLWVHLFDPHAPYDPPEPYATRYALDPYAGEVAYADELVGRLLEALARLRLEENTVIVVLGDHGEGKGDHKESHHGLFIYDTTIRVPLIIRVPGMGHGKVGSVVRVIDVMPTVLDLAGLNAQEGIAGVSLKPLMTLETTDLRLAAYSESYFPNLHFGWSELSSLRAGSYKYIEAPTPELYDLGSDPMEETNLAAVRPRVASRMRESLERLHDEWDVGAAVEAAPVDARTSKALRKLGYTGTTVNRRRGEKLPDPKDKADLVLDMAEAERMIFSGDPFRAVQILNSVVEREPGMLDARISLGVALHEVGDYEREIEVLTETTELSPDFFIAWANLGNALKASGDEARAAKVLERALEIDPESLDVMSWLMDTYFRTGKFKKCEELCLTYIDREPARAEGRVILAMALVNRGRMKKAKAQVEKALRIDPEAKNAHFTLGKILEGERNYEAAVEAYEKELALGTENANLYESLALLYMKLGNREKAIEAAREALQRNPKSRPAGNVLKKLE